MAELPNWIVDELTRFATGERGWNQWGQWLAVSAARLAQEMPRDAFSRLKANPEIEVIRQVAANGVSILPHVHPVLICDPLDGNTHFQYRIRNGWLSSRLGRQDESSRRNSASTGKHLPNSIRTSVLIDQSPNMVFTQDHGFVVGASFGRLPRSFAPLSRFGLQRLGRNAVSFW